MAAQKLSNDVLHHVHIWVGTAKKINIALFFTFSFIAILMLKTIPSFIDISSQIKDKQFSKKANDDASKKLAMEVRLQKEQILKLNQNLKSKKPKQDVYQGGYSESDIEYWGKQLTVFGKLEGFKIDIVSKSKSNFKHAIKLNVSITPIEGNGTVRKLARALDFLQLYGYVESFDGKEAVIHIKGI